MKSHRKGGLGGHSPPGQDEGLPAHCTSDPSVPCTHSPEEASEQPWSQEGALGPEPSVAAS